MELFKAKLGSPVTQLAENITNTQTTISLVNADVLPDAPNIATIGTGVNAETVRYSGKTLNTLTGVTRGFTGTAKVWESGQSIARIFTQYDWDSSVDNIQSLEGGTAGQVLTKVSADDYDFVWGAGGGGGGGSAADITYDNTTSGLTATDVQAAIDEIVVDIGDKAETATYTATLLSTGWTGTEPTTQTLNVTGILSTDEPIADINFESIVGYASQVEANTEWAKILQFTTSTGQVVFDATATPTVDIPILLKVVR